MLAHNCAILQIGVDFGRLYAGADPDYELALGALVDRVHESRRIAAEQARSET